ncbi:T9SS type A sorting domain-containing protein [bacterium SCSIO 12741]|nr:T9SS type A sorting domain-containing protein [bacterium SCSIO 12741]
MNRDWKIIGSLLPGLFLVLFAFGQSNDSQVVRSADAFYSLSGKVFKGSFTMDSVKVFLYREQLPGHAEKIDSVTSYGENGDYEFDLLIPGTYYVQARMVSAQSHDYLDTYYGNQVQWKESTALVLNGDMDHKDISLQSKTLASTGTARVSGTLTYGSGVVNHLEGELASGVQVIVLNAQGRVIAQTYSNQQGKFVVDQLPLLTLGLVVDYPGKSMATVSMEFNSANPTLENLHFIIGKESVEVLDALGAADLEKNSPEIKVFPNPVNDRFYLQGVESSTEIRLRNSQGLEVQHLKYDGDFGVETTNLPAGFYWLEMITSDGIRTIPLVIK